MSSRFVPAAAIAAVALSACQPPAPPLESRAPEHPSVIVTVWEQDLELFVEYPAPVAGASFVLVTHVTHTTSGAPRIAGPAGFLMRSTSGDPFRVDQDAPSRDGIYLPEIIFPTAGEWVITVEIPTPEGVAAVSLPPTAVHASLEEALSAELPAESAGISFLKEQAWRLETLIAPLERRAANRRVSVPAVVLSLPEGSAIVSPPVSGRLEAPDERTLPRLGDQVSAGDILASVRPPHSEFNARLQTASAEALQAELAAQRARAVLERVEGLHQIDARSDLELEHARFESELATASHEAALRLRSALAASGAVFSDDGRVRYEIRAPISGVVREVTAVSGGHVTTGDSLFVIRDSSSVLVEAHIRPEDLDLVTSIESPLFVHLHGGRADPEALAEQHARLVLVGDQLDDHNLTLPVLFELENSDGHLHIGELLEVQLSTGAPSEELMLPTSALVEEEGAAVAYVQLAGETFEKRHLKLGFRDGARVQVLGGIEEGEWVVTRGAFAVRLAAASGGSPSHGHTH